MLARTVAMATQPKHAVVNFGSKSNCMQLNCTWLHSQVNKSELQAVFFSSLTSLPLSLLLCRQRKSNHIANQFSYSKSCSFFPSCISSEYIFSLSQISHSVWPSFSHPPSQTNFGNDQSDPFYTDYCISFYPFVLLNAIINPREREKKKRKGQSH